MDDYIKHLLILGDSHLRRNLQIQESSGKLLYCKENTKWICSKWATIKSAKKEYFKYKKNHGIPAVVVLSVGNNDLRKASSEHCVLTYLFRLANTLQKDGVTAVVICTLFDIKAPIVSYSVQVAQINHVIRGKCIHTRGWFFCELLENQDDNSYKDSTQNFTDDVHKTISSNLKSLLTSGEMMEYLITENPSALKILDDYFILKPISGLSNSLKNDVDDLEESLKNYCGELEVSKFLPDGSALIRVSDRNQGQKVLQIKSIGEIEVAVTPLRKSNLGFSGSKAGGAAANPNALKSIVAEELKSMKTLVKATSREQTTTTNYLSKLEEHLQELKQYMNQLENVTS